MFLLSSDKICKIIRVSTHFFVRSATYCQLRHFNSVKHLSP
jgi:hypothetical protein